uniref:Uncharacterized protein n=1 Tax=Monodelphis domestica TaxID=13616 RepID=A0A5F8GDM1_MONDO
MFISGRRSCRNLNTGKERFLTQKKRNRRLQSSLRLITKGWTLRSCPRSRKFLSSWSTCALYSLSPMEFFLTNWCFQCFKKISYLNIWNTFKKTPYLLS